MAFTKSYKKYLFLIILLLQGLIGGNSQPPNMYVRNFSVTDGLENGYIYSIAQDDLIYFGMGYRRWIVPVRWSYF